MVHYLGAEFQKILQNRYTARHGAKYLVCPRCLSVTKNTLAEQGARLGGTFYVLSCFGNAIKRSRSLLWREIDAKVVRNGEYDGACGIGY